MHNQKDKFWVVMKVTLPTTISKLHNTFTSASAEALRLARRELNSEFVVMETMKSFQKNDIIETEYISSVNYYNENFYVQ